jgi:transposase-like protein
MPTPHCKHCGYPLTALTEPRCPECGNVFDLRDLSTFENRYPRDWHDRIVDLLVIVSLVVIVLSLVAVWVMFKSDPGR